MDLQKLNEEIRKLNEDIITYTGTGKHKVLVELPNGKQEVKNLDLSIIGKARGHYDTNLFGTEPQYATAGYQTEDIEYDLNDVEIEDYEYDTLPEGTRLVEIIEPLEDIEWEFQDAEPEEPDYEEY